jgi:N-acetylglucosamine-6-phosphate deacetylase
VDSEFRPIDLHLHGVGEFDTRTESAEDILSIARIEGEQGVSAIILSIYPAPLVEMRRHLTAVEEAMERQRSRVVDHRPNVQPARIIGVHLEGPFLNLSRCGALDPRAFLSPSLYAYRALIEGFEEIIGSITIAPELAGAPELIKEITRSGVLVSMGHSDALFSEAEAGFRAGASGVTHVFNAMRPFAHREPGIAGFALLNPDVYIEVIADPYHLHMETIRLIFRTKPTDRILIVSDSVKGASVGGPGEGSQVGESEGTDQWGAAATDEAGHLRGGSMSVVAASKRLIAAGFEKGAVMKAITENPARMLRW